MKNLGALVIIAAALMLGACGHALSSTQTTGLTGVVVRRPITPVCRVDIPCDAPFSAGFSVAQNARQVAEFRSDAQGNFTVSLSAGTYRITPKPDAPLMAPSIQTRTVEVGRMGLTYVTLQFDTGIR